MRNVSDRIVEKINTRFVFSNFFFFENRAVYEILCKNIVDRGRPRMTTWLMHIARWISKATNTHSVCVILDAFPLQQLHERASVLGYTYITCFVLVRY
jgi:hypothetical protein